MVVRGCLSGNSGGTGPPLGFLLLKDLLGQGFPATISSNPPTGTPSSTPGSRGCIFQTGGRYLGCGHLAGEGEAPGWVPVALTEGGHVSHWGRAMACSPEAEALTLGRSCGGGGQQVLRGLKRRGSNGSCLILGTNRRGGGQLRWGWGGATPPAFPCFVFRALITVLSSSCLMRPFGFPVVLWLPKTLKGPATQERAAQMGTKAP